MLCLLDMSVPKYWNSMTCSIICFSIVCWYGHIVCFYYCYLMKIVFVGYLQCLLLILHYPHSKLCWFCCSSCIPPVSLCYLLDCPLLDWNAYTPFAFDLSCDLVPILNFYSCLCIYISVIIIPSCMGTPFSFRILITSVSLTRLNAFLRTTKQMNARMLYLIAFSTTWRSVNIGSIVDRFGWNSCCSSFIWKCCWSFSRIIFINFCVVIKRVFCTFLNSLLVPFRSSFYC